ncbi:LamG-like jellyroll fold domain-containing protein [Olleya aquimaris]|uniref:LamG-like jellyroll fold domain-containing protein n=1 Tax=Olleya aquimaris TaxID=639310 RepID=UPI0013144368|nr:LamG-like jellyroll fold domain-containing protein [Olleya aquimaris]
MSLTVSVNAQINAPSIQSGVSFQWSDNQTGPKQPATIESITVNGNVYFQFGVPSAYELTQLGPNGHGYNSIRLNGPKIETTSASPTWNSSALTSYQSLNLNNYFETNGNGANICDNYLLEGSTNAQRQTLSYGSGIIASSSGVVAITERNANNCYHIEFFGIPVGGGAEQSLGETFVNQGSTKYGFGGTGSTSNLGTPGAVNPPQFGSDYWLSDRVIDNYGTIGIALFYLDDIAPTGSLITKAQITAASYDDGDGKLFILTLPDSDNDKYSDVDDLDDDNDGISDLIESNGIDPSADHDVDGTPNYQDADFCVLNSAGICANLDIDSDGIPNHLDLDSDNDGITDVMESGGTDANFDGKADGTIGTGWNTSGIPSSAGSGNNPMNTDNTNNYNFLDIDSDDDGIPDNIEAQPTNGYIAPSGNGLLMTDLNQDGIDDAYGFGLTSLIDTDRDNTPDYLDDDSDNDGLLDIEENGMVNTIGSYSDADNDGLDNVFEGTNTNDPSDVNDQINNPADLLILPDSDGDLSSGGDLDYRDLFNINPPASASIDFDGIDDYLSGNSLLNGLGEITFMAWVKSDPVNGTKTYTTVAGEDISCRIIMYNGVTPIFSIRTSAGITSNVIGNSINYNEWHHITGTFSATTGTQTIYVDGKKDTSTTSPIQVGQVITTTSSWNGNFEVGRLSRNTSNKQYFTGEIDEVRVFNEALTTDQIQRIVYQEIENNSGDIKGTIINKDILDIATSLKVSWNNLIGYYPMSNIISNTTKDYSSYDNFLTLNNITTVQGQTAPMPYVTSMDGDWTSQSTWLHGEVWDIEDVSTNKDWSIVQVKNNITSSNSHTQLGLYIDAGKTFTVNGDNAIINNWYLGLDGTLVLQSDSQLIQSINSDLVTLSSGKIKRRQEGVSSVYRYNYWSSPVGVTANTSLTNNNTLLNNSNNTSFSLNMLKDSSGNDVQFTNAYHEDGKISSYWLYSYQNGVTYYDWDVLSTSTPLVPGMGYTQKGGGSLSEYTFEGKPNNGTILLSATDTGGSGSVPGVSKTEYLVGNPYASAIDAHQFIDDNSQATTGAIYLWEQWAGDSHILNQYQGGYATLNKLGKVRAYQFIGINGGATADQSGTKTPKRYLPVGQGFMVEINNTGDIVFNNNQRIFKTESSGDSQFFRTSNNETESSIQEPAIQKMKLQFTTDNGLGRELVLGFSDTTSDAFDYGYDAFANETFANDLTLPLSAKQAVIQAYSPITTDKEIELSFTSGGTMSYSIIVSEFENFTTNQEVYLLDNQTGIYHDLTSELAYDFTSEAGTFENRFKIVFQKPAALSNEEFQLNSDKALIYFNNDSELLFVKGLELEARSISLHDASGKKVFSDNFITKNQLEKGLLITSLSTGLYVVSIQLDNAQIINKKLIIN